METPAPMEPLGQSTHGPSRAEELVTEVHAQLEKFAVPSAMLERLFAFAPVGFQLYAANGRSLFTNHAFLQMFGSVPPPEYNVLEDEIAERYGVLGLIRRAFEGEVVRVPPVWYDPRELTRVRVNEGRRVAIDSTFFPVFAAEGAVTHVGVVFKDVTAELIAREEAEAERDLLRAIVEQSGDGIIVADAEGDLRIFNPEAARQHGRSFEHVRAEQWAEAYAFETEQGEPLALERTPLWRALHGESVTSTYWVANRRDGTRRLLAGNATPLRGADGTVRGAMIITRDETERRHIAEERRIAQYKDRVIGILGHDLRAPLTAIRASASMLERRAEADEGDLRDAVKRAVQRIEQSADRMNRMIGDVLDFTRARIGGGIPVKRRPTDLGAVALTVLDELRTIDPSQSLRLETQGSLEGEWDPDRLAQVVQNLVGNALVHGEPGKPILVAIDGRETEVQLSVQSHGPPIPSGTVARMFDPFRRGADSRRGRDEGIGLGLYIVRSLVEAHRGRIHVHSAAPDGTTFTVRLPRA